MEINVQAQVAHRLEKHIVISAKITHIDGMEEMAYSTLGYCQLLVVTMANVDTCCW